jgi:hypothetical protein
MTKEKVQSIFQDLLIKISGSQYNNATNQAEKAHNYAMRDAERFVRDSLWLFQEEAVK